MCIPLLTSQILEMCTTVQYQVHVAATMWLLDQYNLYTKESLTWLMAKVPL